MVKKIAVFSSGKGGNFNNICEYFSVVKNVSVDLLVTNNLDSMSKKIADINKVDSFYADKAVMLTGKLNKALEERGIDLIVLAGFILKIPNSLVAGYTSHRAL